MACTSMACVVMAFYSDDLLKIHSIWRHAKRRVQQMTRLQPTPITCVSIGVTCLGSNSDTPRSPQLACFFYYLFWCGCVCGRVSET